MAFQDDLSQKVYEIVKVAFLGRGYNNEGQIHHEQAEGGGMIAELFPTNCSPADVWDAFEPFFNTCDPTTGDETASLFFDAATQLHEAQALHFCDIDRDLDEWRGDAADAFRERLQGLWWSTANLQTLLEEFSTLYKGYQTLIQGTQQDVLRLADATIEALKGYREAQRRQSQQANMLAATLVVGVIATVATAGVAAPVAATTSGAAAANVIVAGAAISVAEQGINTAVAMNNLEVEGSNLTEIMDSLFKAIGDLLDNTGTQINAIIAGINSAADIMRDTNFVPPVPEQIYQPFNPEEFRVPSDIMPDSIAASASHDPLGMANPVKAG